MTTTKKIKLRFTKAKPTKKASPRTHFRPLMKEAHGPGFGDIAPESMYGGAGEASAQNPFVEAAQAIIEAGEVGEVPLEVLASAIAELPSMRALNELFGGQGQPAAADSERGPDPGKRLGRLDDF